MAFIYDLADEWTDSGTTYAGIKLDVADTASSASSLLMDLQVGGASKFKVDKAGGILISAGSASSPALVVGSAVNSGVYSAASNQINFRGNGLNLITLGGSVPKVSVFTNNGFELTQGGGVSVFMFADATHSLAQRNGTNAQTFNLYNTYTDASNYERGFMKWNSNVLEIGTEAAGTGSARDVLVRRGGLKAVEIQSGYVGFYNGAGTRTALLNATVGQFNTLTSGRYGFGAADTVDAHIYRPAAAVVGIGGAANAGGSAEFKEIASAPAAATNAVRIYAEDDGAGKTRLMALFPTGAAQQIAIEP